MNTVMKKWTDLYFSTAPILHKVKPWKNKVKLCPFFSITPSPALWHYNSINFPFSELFIWQYLLTSNGVKFDFYHHSYVIINLFIFHRISRYNWTNPVSQLLENVLILHHSMHIQFQTKTVVLQKLTLFIVVWLNGKGRVICAWSVQCRKGSFSIWHHA